MYIKLLDLRKIKSIQTFLADKEMKKIKKRANRKPSGLPRGVYGKKIKIIGYEDTKDYKKGNLSKDE